MATLVVLDGYQSGSVIALAESLIVGRDPKSGLRMTDPLVSSRHAAVRMGEQGFEIADLASTNGTFLNGDRIAQPTSLRLGDVIRIGSTHLLFTDQEDPERGGTAQDSLAPLREESFVHDSLVGSAGPQLEGPKVRWITDVDEGILLGDSGAHSGGRGLKLALPVVDAVQRSFSVAWDLPDLIQRIAQGFVRATEAEGVAVFVIRQDAEDPELALIGRANDEGIKPEEDPGFEVDLGLAHKALAERGAIVSDIGPDAGSTSVLSKDASTQTTTVICVSLPSAAGIVGGVYLHGTAPGLNRNDLRLLLLMANLAGVHLRSHLLLDRVRSQTAALEGAYRELREAKEVLADRHEALEGELGEALLRGRLLSRIVEHVQEAVVSTTLDGVVTSWNHGAEELYGHRAADVIGETLPTVPDERGPELERILEAVSAGRSFAARTARVTRDEVLVPVLATYAPVSSADGEVVGLVEIARDLRERLREEERLRYQVRVASFSELAATLAHEIGNPLANLRSGVEWLLAREREPAEVKESLETLHSEIDRLHRLAREALSLARWRQPDAQPVSAAQLVDYVIQTLARRAEEALVEVERFGESDLTLKGDADQLKQALLNLADNALDAMPTGGRLELGIEREAGDVLLTVRDSGAGVSAEVKRRMFEPFYSTRQAGTGIGLAVVRRVAHLHGGEVEVESEPNRGTAITIRIPEGVDE